MVGKCMLIPKNIRPFPESWRKLSDYDRIELFRSNKQNWACSLTLLKRNYSPYGWNIVCSKDQKCCLMPQVQIISLFWTVCIITFLNWNNLRPSLMYSWPSRKYHTHTHLFSLIHYPYISDWPLTAYVYIPKHMRTCIFACMEEQRLHFF